MSTKVHLVKAMVFPVVMCGCESWTIKKAEHRKVDAFELWYCRRLLRVIHPVSEYIEQLGIYPSLRRIRGSTEVCQGDRLMRTLGGRLSVNRKQMGRYALLDS